METLDEQKTIATTKVDRSAMKAKVSFPTEIIEEIVLRLPVKSILRFRSVSKPWLSHISRPSFTKLHFTRATQSHRTTLFFSAFDKYSTNKRYLFSAAPDGGPLTHLITLHDVCGNIEAQHLNGLVYFTCMRFASGNTYPHAFVVNPSTRKLFSLHDPYFWTGPIHICYLFGFDESTNEHKILKIGHPPSPNPNSLEIMIFSMSSHSWRKINAELPFSVSWNSLYYVMTKTKRSVCVNSVIHLMLLDSPFDILAFDLRTDKFSIINTPQGVVPRVAFTVYTRTRDGRYSVNNKVPHIIKINGCIGVVCHDRVVENNEMHIWVLQDYENRVWIREIITFPTPWIDLDRPFPLDSVNMDEIIFSSRYVDWGHAMSVYVYNKKSRCFKSLQFTLAHQFLCLRKMEIDQIRCYVESMVPL